MPFTALACLRGAAPFFFFFLSDDAVIFCKAAEDEAREVMSVLQCYAEGSGQIFNREKSSLFFSAHYPKKRKKKIMGCTNIRGGDNFSTYLGLTVDFGHSKTAVF